MKLAFFYRQLNQGGIQRVIVNCANYFAEHGHEVCIILMKREGEYHELLHTGVRVIYFESLNKIRLYRSLRSILEKEKFDLLFSATPDLNTLTLLYKIFSRTKTKIVISEHNNTRVFFKHMKLSLSKLSFLSIPILYRFADAIVAVSKGLGDNLRKVALLGNDKITVIFNPAYSALLEEQLSLPVTHEWFGPRAIPVIISVGRLTEAKNHQLLIEAMHLLSKKRTARLLIIGEGHLREALQQQIDHLGLSHLIQLPGFKLNPVSWIREADLFVLSSDYEGFGVVLVEALAAGTTIVSTDCNYGPAEILDGACGYLVPVGDAPALAAQMDFAIDHPISRSSQVARAKEFSTESIMRKYNQLFTDLIEK